MGWRARGIHWLLVLGIWLQGLGPVLAHPAPAGVLDGVQLVACTPAGMVLVELSPGESDPGRLGAHRHGHCLLCATTPALPAATGSGAALPVAPWAQPLLPVATPVGGGHRVAAWTRPPVRSPPTHCR